MAIKKSELYSSLWKSCDELRGGMDASQYKDYVLVLLFMKYFSDKAASQKGYLLDVPKGGSFADTVALKGDKEIGDKINKIIAKLAWIKKQRAKFETQPRQSEREMVSGESHYFLGRRYRLRIIEQNGVARVFLRGKSSIDLHMRKGSRAEERE